MSKLWKLKPKAPKEILDRFPELDPLIVQILYNRGIVEENEVERFLDPQYENLHSPLLFRDMQKAVERVWKAIEEGEKILVYSDYDADAVTANALMQQTFRYLNYPIDSYIPDRFTEGYGLNLEAFKKIKAQGITVVITVDCGTNSLEIARFCKHNGIDLIITDHHEIIGEKPDAFALINPKNREDSYPDQQITGVGVAYKLAKAILENPKSKIKNPKFIEGWDKWLLDLVAIGTVADCHSLAGENHILVAFGLKVLTKTKWVGLRQLMIAAGADKAGSLDTYTLGFVIAPRINAAGRLEHANAALDLLLATDYAQAESLAQNLNIINKRRQDLTLRLVSEAQEQALQLGDKKILLLKSADWPKGVVGLVAGKLANEYARPVIVLEHGESESTGSARSVGSFDIIECLKSAAHLLKHFGGHKQAAGLTLKSENIEEFYRAILEFAEKYFEHTEPWLELEAQLSESDLALSTVEKISKIEPFGVENPKPKFLLPGVRFSACRVVGNGQKHLQFQVYVGQTAVNGIAFNMARICNQFRPGDTADLAVELMTDNWNGDRKLKLRLADIRKTE